MTEAKDKETEKKTEHLHYKLEVLAAILIGLATLLGAWCAYNASLSNGNSVENYNQGINTISHANRSSVEGVEKYMFDMTIWIEYLKHKEKGEEIADKIKHRVMSDEFKQALDWSEFINKKSLIKLHDYEKRGDTSEQKLKELDEEVQKYKEEADEKFYKHPDYSLVEEYEDNDYFTPEESQIYIKSIKHESDSLFKAGNEQMQLGQSYNKMSDKYTMLIVLFTIVLFFSGISSTVKHTPLKIVFLSAACLTLLVSVIRLLMLSV